ncbi:O-antigen translocase [Algibacter miyuki]|uniref:O-antigen translocase n=1 Tax=Algibacter miyuki TaxID=1306933 RepID=A0ABV5GZA3_9FLAO|nr:O-antigen translocase [Algibacter miyuki]MDN3665907.1 O-antigen translocase [Algibacter miyuki]
MKPSIHNIKHHVLSKLASVKSISVLIKVTIGVLISKAVALFIGPVGFALIGNLENFVSALHHMSVLGMYNTLVKYIGEFRDDLCKLSKLLSTAFYIGYLSCVLISVLCYLNAETLNNLIFPIYNNYTYVIEVFAIALPFYAINMFSFAILKGFSKYNTLLLINSIGQILSGLIALILIYQTGIEGALISVVISESLIFLITLVGIINRRSLSGLVKVNNIKFDFLKKIAPFSVMSLFSAVILPLVALSIRSYIIDNLGYKEAGFWEAMNRISRYYFMFGTALMGYYVLPRLSKIDNVRVFWKAVLCCYKILIPVFIVAASGVYFSKSIIVSLIFSDEFSPVESLFFWQLLGDFMRALSLIMVSQFLVKKMFWHYLLTEIGLVIALYMFSIYYIDLYQDVNGAVMAHFVSYTIYFSIVVLVLTLSLFGADKRKLEV